MSIRTWFPSTWARMKRWWAGLVAAVMAALAGIFALHAQAPSATLTWVAPTTYTDGTAIPSTQVITYDINQGPKGAETQVATGVTGITWTTTTGLTPGSTVCWTVQSVDAQQGTTSVPSNEACKSFAARVPNPPTNAQAK